jgi:hypothetical protein
MKYFKRMMLNSLAWLFVIISLIYGLAEVRAETYNFYFNNAEQGENSRAAPSVVVNQGGEGGAQAASPSLPARESETPAEAQETQAEAHASQPTGMDAVLNPIRNLIPAGIKSGF